MGDRTKTRSRRGGILSVLLLAASCAAFGLDPDRTISQFFHTSWTVSNGGPSGLSAIAQTTDGYLWLGTQTGLIRFDGVRFERYSPVSGEFPSNDVSALRSMPDGGLWIGFAPSGATFLKGGRAVTYREKEGLPTAPVYGFGKNGDTIWLGTSRGLWRFDGSLWHAANSEWGFPDERADSFFEDREGRFWVATPDRLFCLPERAHKFELRETAKSVRLGQTKGGALWATGPNDTLERFTGTSEPTHARPAQTSQTSARQILVDRDGGMWVATYGEGIARIPNPDGRTEARLKFAGSIQHFTEKDGLSDNRVMATLEDHEGNVWVATRGGLDRFRARNVVPAAFPYGTGEQDLALAPDRDGAIWAGSLHQPLMLQRKDVLSVRGGPRNITAAYRDSEGTLWFGGLSSLTRMERNRMADVALPREIKPGSDWPVQAITRDRTGDLWVSVTQHGVFRLHGNIWTAWGNVAALPKRTAVTLWTDPDGRVWFGYTGDLVALLEGDKVRTFSGPEGLEIGAVTAFGGSRGHIWAGGQTGLATFDGQRFHRVGGAPEGELSGVSGIVEMANGDLWLNQASGVAHIPAAEAAAVLKDAHHHPTFDLFDFRDGVAGIASPLRPLPSAILSGDGRIWVSGTNGAAWIDPARIYRNPLPPPVAIEALLVDGKRHDLASLASLPPHPSNLRIEYTALSLSIPERVHFRYQLEGFDKDWQEAETRRTAFYTRLGPGNYRFHVIACNNDGVWNTTGATLGLTVLPAFYQTASFLALCTAAAGGILWGLYVLRLRHMAMRMQKGLEQRLAERERIARELHDTLLQGFQGLILRFQAAAKQISRSEPARDTMEEALDHADQVMEEGRDRLRGLRFHVEVQGALSAAFTRSGQELAPDFPGTAHRVVVEGTPVDLYPEVQDEIYRIGREALVNAFYHAAAREIEVEISYKRREVQLRLRDDGRGIDPEVFALGGRPGHWGLTGMHERAQKIGARLDISSRPGAGTEIELRVPAAIAYRGGGRAGSLFRRPRRSETWKAAK